MRNLLEEFRQDHGLRPATILGVREHVFTGRFNPWVLSLSDHELCFKALRDVLSSFIYFSVSSLAWFMSNQETSFVTLGQRVLADPLK